LSETKKHQDGGVKRIYGELLPKAPSLVRADKSVGQAACLPYTFIR